MVSEGTRLLEEDGIQREKMFFELTCDMRYVGQEYTVNVLLNPKMDINKINEEFHKTYNDRYGHSTPDAPVECVNLRLAVIGQMDRAPMRFEPEKTDANALIGERQVVFDRKNYETPIFQRSRIKNKSIMEGPFIIEEDTATTIVPPGYQGKIDKFGNIIITLE